MRNKEVPKHSTRKSFAICTIITLLTVVLVPKLKDLKILVSMSELVDKNLPSSQNYQHFKEEFNLKNTFSIILKKKTRNWSKDEFNKIENWQNEILYEKNLAEQITSPFSFLKTEIQDEDYIFYKKIIKRDHEKSNLNFFNQTPWKNIITNEAGNEFSMEIELADAPPPQKFGSFDPFSIKKIIKSANDIFSQTYQVLVIGPAAFTYYAFVGVKQNTLLNIAYLLFLFVLFKFLFGTFKSGFFLLLSFSWVGIIVYAIMATFKIPLEILSSGLFIMIAVSSLEDYFFILHENAKGKSLDEAFESLKMPSLLTSCTTVLGFGSLYFSGIDLVARFGVMAAIGALLEWFAVFIVLPEVFKLLKVTTLIDKSRDFITSPKWDHFLQKIKPKKILSYLTLLCFPFSIAILFNLQVSDSPLSLFPKNHAIKYDFSLFSESRDWEAYSSLVFDENQTLKTQEKIINKIQKIENIKYIENQDQLNRFITTGIPEKYKEAVKNDFRGSKLNKRYESEYYKQRHILYFKSSQFNTLKQTKYEIENICQENCKIIGEIISYTEFADKIPLGFMKSLGLSLLTVAIFIIILALRFRFPRPILFSLASLWGPSILLILIWIFQIKINFLSCVFVTMMVGLTGDNAIQFIYAQRKGHDGIHYHQKCAFQMGILLCLSCLFFLLSYFNPPREFGPIMAIGFLFSIFGDICLAKTLTQKT
jgi:predicted RND superfamily exporter protein